MMKMGFVCNECEVAFGIDSEHLPNKTSITCPNCEAKLSDEAFVKLQQGAALIDEAKSKASSQPTENGNVPAFDFTVEG